MGFFNVSYEVRFDTLSTNLKSFAKVNKELKHYVDLVLTKEVNNQEEAQALFEEYLASGQEGTILKSKDAIWEDKRSKGQIKFKGELDCDLKVVDWVEGTGKNVGRLGALVCESEDGLIQVNVGSGYTDAERDSFGREVIGKIVAVKYNARIKDRGEGIERLFLPIFIEIREDKDVADISTRIK
jgi:ATP-dependent DNA ligase